jgi:putative transcriptional regulator
MPKAYKSDVFASIHETISDLHEIGVLDKCTMREYDDLCLTEIAPISPVEIKEIREEANVSQAIFAHYLNVSKGLVSQWERGVKHPSGASLKLLTLVRKLGLQAIA